MTATVRLRTGTGAGLRTVSIAKTRATRSSRSSGGAVRRAGVLERVRELVAGRCSAMGVVVAVRMMVVTACVLEIVRVRGRGRGRGRESSALRPSILPRHLLVHRLACRVLSHVRTPLLLSVADISARSTVAGSSNGQRTSTGTAWRAGTAGCWLAAPEITGRGGRRGCVRGGGEGVQGAEVVLLSSAGSRREWLRGCLRRRWTRRCLRARQCRRGVFPGVHLLGSSHGVRGGGRGVQVAFDGASEGRQRRGRGCGHMQKLFQKTLVLLSRWMCTSRLAVAAVATVVADVDGWTVFGTWSWSASIHRYCTRCRCGCVSALVLRRTRRKRGSRRS